MKKKYNISIVGQSNTGKSTLINYLCDKYVTAESKKLQTTRVNLYNSVSLNGMEIMQQAESEILKLEQEVRSNYEEPPHLILG